MKVIKTASGLKAVISRSDWESIGKKHGWIKEGYGELPDPAWHQGPPEYPVDYNEVNTEMAKEYIGSQSSWVSQIAFLVAKAKARKMRIQAPDTDDSEEWNEGEHLMFGRLFKDEDRDLQEEMSDDIFNLIEYNEDYDPEISMDFYKKYEPYIQRLNEINQR